MRAYVAMRYHLGVPVIPEGHGFVKHPFFAFDALDEIGVPSMAQWPLIPLLIPTALAAELVNLAAENAFPAAMLVALGLGSICSRTANKKAKRTRGPQTANKAWGWLPHLAAMPGASTQSTQSTQRRRVPIVVPFLRFFG